MYQIETNFGVYTCKLAPSLEDTLKYWHKAHSAGIEVKDIKFVIRELPNPKAVSISTILKDVW